MLAPGRKAYEVTADAGPLPASGLRPGPAARKLAAPAGAANLGLAVGRLLFALIGGLILNLMPCVFPMLAMKAASLAGHSGEQARRARQGLAFRRRRAGDLPGAWPALLIALRAAGARRGLGLPAAEPRRSWRPWRC